MLAWAVILLCFFHAEVDSACARVRRLGRRLRDHRRLSQALRVVADVWRWVLRVAPLLAACLESPSASRLRALRATPPERLWPEFVAWAGTLTSPAPAADDSCLCEGGTSLVALFRSLGEDGASVTAYRRTITFDPAVWVEASRDEARVWCAVKNVVVFREAVTATLFGDAVYVEQDHRTVFKLVRRAA